MTTPENERKEDIKRVSEITSETQVIEEEISPDEFFNLVKKEEEEFKQETKVAESNLNSVGLPVPTFENIKMETGVIPNLEAVNKEAEVIAGEAKSEAESRITNIGIKDTPGDNSKRVGIIFNEKKNEDNLDNLEKFEDQKGFVLRILKDNNSIVNIILLRDKALQYDDIKEILFLALLEAKKKFNPALGVKFSAYAYHRVLGALYDLRRKISPLSRGNADNYKKIKEAQDRLTQKLGRDPSLKEIAEKIGISVEELSEWKNEIGMEQSQHRTPLSLSQSVHNKDESSPIPYEEVIPNDDPDPLERLIKQEPKEIIMKIISQQKRKRITEGFRDEEGNKNLSSHAWDTFLLHYFEDKDWKYIAKKFEISEGRVSQLLKQAREKLKELLAKQSPTN